ncbi:hypothetical protein [Sphaerotilus uruguayifluvii]|uniref:Lipoprotein n=1 Tax=Sphaerotilus uruguayifluvii TaxID=2735897 RepID=A0ABX2G2C4_9BURK|nr:hypothetical protein [Leptothrix sp. C29]NRT56447.1 hypothetical protein [Leptothrix sp. C29]
MNIFKKWGLLIFFTISGFGCTTVYVRSDDGTQITVARNIGFTHISSNLTAEGKGSLIYKARGLGLLVSPRGGTLGWVDETTALIGDASRCQMIVWIDSDKSLEQLKNLLSQHQISPDRLCMVAPKAQTQP